MPAPFPSSIASAFGIVPARVTRPDHAFVSGVYMLDESLVLRSRPAEHDSVAALEGQTALLEQVQTAVPYRLSIPLRSKDGAIGVTEDGVFWTLHPFIPGTALGTWQDMAKSPSSETELCLSTLQSLQSATTGLPLPDAGIPLPQDVSRRHKRVAGRLSARSNERIATALARVSQHAADHASTRCFVHGDFHPGNIIVQDGSVTGLIDCDWCRTGHPYEDLAYFALMHISGYESDTFRFDASRLDGLLQEWGLPAQERPVFLEYLLLFAAFDISLFIDEEHPLSAFYLRYQLSCVEQLCERFA